MRPSCLPLLLSSRIRSSSTFRSSTLRPATTRVYSLSSRTPADASSPLTSPSSSAPLAFDDKHSPSSTWNPSLRNPVVPYPQSAKKYVGRAGILKPPYAETGLVPPSPYGDAILIHNDPQDLERMRVAARLARRVLDHACDLAKPGVTSDEIDSHVHEALLKAGAYPSPLNYVGFPKSLCSSINEVICHGIPDARPLQNGDIVSFDVSCFINGVHGDNCATILVGDEQEEDEIGVDWRGVPYKSKDRFADEEEEAMFRAGRRLIHATREALYEAIHRCGPGACLTDVGDAIQEVADAYGYSTVEKYRGHGIGEVFHCAPFVKHYRNNDKLELLPGMIFTIEPMLVEGYGECFEWDDHWTVATCDGGMAAQFEHTILITDNGVEILTIPEDEES